MKPRIRVGTIDYYQWIILCGGSDGLDSVYFNHVLDDVGKDKFRLNLKSIFTDPPKINPRGSNSNW